MIRITSAVCAGLFIARVSLPKTPATHLDARTDDRRTQLRVQVRIRQILSNIVAHPRAGFIGDELAESLAHDGEGQQPDGGRRAGRGDQFGFVCRRAEIGRVSRMQAAHFQSQFELGRGCRRQPAFIAQRADKGLKRAHVRGLCLDFEPEQGQRGALWIPHDLDCVKRNFGDVGVGRPRQKHTALDPGLEQAGNGQVGRHCSEAFAHGARQG